MKQFFAHYANKTDCQDDEVVKILAKTKPAARRLAVDHCRWNFSLKRVMTRKQLKKWDPEWHALLWGKEAIFVQGEDG